MRSLTTPYARGAAAAAEQPAPRFDGAEALRTRVPFVGPRDPVHGPIVPADVRTGDPIAASITLRDGSAVVAPVWRISPLGVDVVRTAALASVEEGDALDLTLRVGDSVSAFPCARVAAVRSDRDRELLALRLGADAQPDGEAAPAEKREAARWGCGDEYLPTGVARSSVRYDDHVHFRIADISRRGMRLVTSLRNKFLVPGVRFRARCAFPTLGEAEIAFSVVRAQVVSDGCKRHLAVGVTWSVEDARARDRVARYLLRFGPGTSLRALRADGFELAAATGAFEYGSVRTEAEYREVLALRRLTYAAAGKISADARDEDMADELDRRSRILVARHLGRIVATMRLMFPRSAADPLKHSEYLPLPATLPPADQLVEVSKACTHPDYRGGELFYEMTKRAAITTLQSGRRYVLMSCTAPLVPIYRKLGVREIGASYVHPTMGLEHHMLLGDIAAMTSGKGMNPIFWNVVIGHDVWDYFCACGVLPVTPALRARVCLWKAFKPLAFLASLYVRSLRSRSRRG